MTRVGAIAGAAGLLLAALPAFAAGPDIPPKPEAAPAAHPPEADAKDEAPLVYIFSGALAGGETYSGTLVAAAAGPEFELKLGKGATCDGNRLEPDKGLLRLPETPCSDGRALKALFVYQEGGMLRVYGTIGPDRFSTQAHALPTDAAEPPAAKPAAPPADLMERPR